MTGLAPKIHSKTRIPAQPVAAACKKPEDNRGA